MPDPQQGPRAPRRHPGPGWRGGVERRQEEGGGGEDKTLQTPQLLHLRVLRSLFN